MNITLSGTFLQVHFEASQFETNVGEGRMRLRHNAVPTLFQVPNPPDRIGTNERKSTYKKPKETLSPHKEQFPSNNEQCMNSQVPSQIIYIYTLLLTGNSIQSVFIMGYFYLHPLCRFNLHMRTT